MLGMKAHTLKSVVALIAGLLFFAIGVYLMVQGLSSTSGLDIESWLLSGKIQRGSAGLFIALLATVIVVFALATGNDPNRSSRVAPFRIAPVTWRLAWVLASLLLAAMAASLAIPAGGPENLLHSLLKGVMIALGIASAVIFIALLFTVFDWDGDDGPPAA